MEGHLPSTPQEVRVWSTRKPTSLALISAQVQFNLKRVWHNYRYLIFAVVLPIGLYVLYAQMYGANRAFHHTIWGAYFMISMAAFGAIGTTLNFTGTLVAHDRARGWIRYQRLTPLGRRDWVVGQVLSGMVASLMVIGLVVCSAVTVEHLPFTRFIGEAAILIWIGSLAYATLGLVVAHLMDATSVNYGVTLIYLASGFLGGLWTPLSLLPPVFRHIASVFPSYRMAELGW